MDTKRQRIVAAIVERLREIRVADGYQTDAGERVEDWQTNWDESEMPAISVCDLPEQSEKSNLDARKTTHDLHVHVRVFVRSNTPASELRKIIGDVQRAVGKDLRWSKLALDTMPKQAGMVVPEDSFVIAGGAVEFIVQYMTGTFDPYQ